ncbi:MAG: EutP/PduV family microcompartment system protein [Lachnospiraceae bacterium]
MKKLMLIGRSECGKTTLKQALRGEALAYQKTQAVDYMDFLIDTPGEYAQTKNLGGALALYSYEADIVGLVIQANDQYSLFPPNIVSQSTREVIGIITQTDTVDANIDRARLWLELAGCTTIFYISSYTGDGIEELLQYLDS